MSEQETGDEHFGPHALLVAVAEEPVVPQALESHQDVNGLTVILKRPIMFLYKLIWVVLQWTALAIKVYPTFLYSVQ